MIQLKINHINSYNNNNRKIIVMQRAANWKQLKLLYTVVHNFVYKFRVNKHSIVHNGFLHKNINNNKAVKETILLCSGAARIVVLKT